MPHKIISFIRSENFDDLELMMMVYELTEKEKKSLWKEGYIEEVILHLPTFARDTMEQRVKAWEDTVGYVKDKLEIIVGDKHLKEKKEESRKEFAIYVMDTYPSYQSLIFKYFDNKLREKDFKDFVYRRSGKNNRIL